MPLPLRPVADRVELDADQRGRGTCGGRRSTIASLMYGRDLEAFSISDGEMFLPPAVMMMSFMRSVIVR